VVDLPIFAIRCFCDLSGNKKTMVFPAPVTSDLRPKTELEIFAFAQAKQITFGILCFITRPMGLLRLANSTFIVALVRVRGYACRLTPDIPVELGN